VKKVKLKMEGTYPSFYIPSAHHQPMSLYAEHSPINLAKSDHFPLCVFSGFFPILCCYKSAHNPVFPLLHMPQVGIMMSTFLRAAAGFWVLLDLGLARFSLVSPASPVAGHPASEVPASRF
jgi:hypothetical protein